MRKFVASFVIASMLLQPLSIDATEVPQSFTSDESQGTSLHEHATSTEYEEQNSEDQSSIEQDSDEQQGTPGFPKVDIEPEQSVPEQNTQYNHTVVGDSESNTDTENHTGEGMIEDAAEDTAEEPSWTLVPKIEEPAHIEEKTVSYNSFALDAAKTYVGATVGPMLASNTETDYQWCSYPNVFIQHDGENYNCTILSVENAEEYEGMQALSDMTSGYPDDQYVLVKTDAGDDIVKIADAEQAVCVDDTVILRYSSKMQAKMGVHKLNGNATVDYAELSVDMKTQGGNNTVIDFNDSTDVHDGKLVAVIDTGLDKTYAQSIDAESGTSFCSENTDDDNGHGTNVTAAIMEASEHRARILPVKVADATGNASIVSTFLGIKYAIQQGVDIINISLNTITSDKSECLADVIEEATAAGIEVVVSAGNDSADACNAAPADCMDAIVVSATDANGKFADYSNYGKTVDYSASGEFNDECGTSFAAARVSGLLAVHASDVLVSLGQDFGDDGWDAYYGECTFLNFGDSDVSAGIATDEQSSSADPSDLHISGLDEVTYDVTGLAAGSVISHNCNSYLVTKNDSSKHWKECRVCGKHYNEAAHSYTKNYWTGGSASDCSDSNRHVYQCSCGYSYSNTTGKAAHSWSSGYTVSYQVHRIACNKCYATKPGTRDVHRNSSGQQIMCKSPRGNQHDSSRRCATCGFTQDQIHQVGVWYQHSGNWGATCSFCGESLFDVNGSSWYPTYNTATGVITVHASIHIPNVHYAKDLSIAGLSPVRSQDWKDYKITWWQWHEDTRVLDITFDTHVNGHTELVDCMCLTLGYHAADGGWVVGWHYFYPRVEYERPNVTRVGQSVGDKVNGWETTKTILFQGVENYCGRVTFSFKDSDGNEYLSNASAGVSNGAWSYSCTPQVETPEYASKDFVFTVTDSVGNQNVREVTLRNVDAKAPSVSTTGSTSTEWSRSKVITLSGSDHGSKRVKIGFNDQTNWVATDASGDNFSRRYKLVGDVYGTTQAAIYYKDAAGNVATKFLNVSNIDNTAPTVTETEKQMKSGSADIIVHANDTNQTLKAEGSGVKYYGISKKNDVSSIKSWQTSNVFSTTESGTYYVFVKDAVGNISATNSNSSITVSGLNSKLTLTATANPTANNRHGGIDLDWSAYETPDVVFKGYQSKDAGKTWQSISLMDFNHVTRVKVLNVYPDKGDNLKTWMESNGYGKGIIKVDKVSLSAFNANPSGYLKCDYHGDWNYDIVFFGSWDANNYKDINESAYKVVRQFANAGRGVVLGHDTIAGIAACNHPWFNRFAKDLNITVHPDINGIECTTSLGSEKVKVKRISLLTTFPFDLGAVGTEYTIPKSHNLNQAINSTKYIDFQFESPLKDKRPEFSWYVTSNNNFAMIQTGHSNGQATNDEQKILANVIFYCYQLTSARTFTDNSAIDYAAPNKPTVEFGKDGAAVAFSATDNGTRYDYYVQSFDKKDVQYAIATSNKVNATVATGISGYYFVCDDKETNNFRINGATFVKSAITNTALITGPYLHVRAIDYAGNVSAVTNVPVMYEMTTKHWKYNPNAEKYELWSTTTEKKQYGSTYTPSYLDAPTGFHKQKIDGAKKVAGDMTFNAYYYPNEYDLTYDGKTNGGDANKTVKWLYSKYLDFSPTTTKTGDTGIYSKDNTDGWQFIGWNTDKDTTIAMSGQYSMPASNLTIYAQFKKDITARWSQHTGTVDGASPNPIAVNSLETKTVYNNVTTATFEPPEKQSITRWSNDGWTLQTKQQAELTSNYTVNKDTHWYARYSRKIAHKFTDQHGTTIRSGTRYTNSADILNLTHVYVNAPVILDKAFWVRQGWTTKKTATALVELKERQSVELTDDRQYWARYNKSIRVDANAQDDEFKPWQESRTGTGYYNTAGAVQYPTFKFSAPPWLDGASFEYWNSKEDLSGVNFEAEKQYTFEDSAILYPKYHYDVPAHVELDVTSLSLLVGDCKTVTATVTPQTAKNLTIHYYVEDSSIASVDSSGNVTALKQGQTKLVATSASDASVHAECTITVSAGSVIIPKQVVLGSPAKLVIKNNGAKEVSLKLSGLTQLRGVKTGKSYALKYNVWDGSKYQAIKVGETIMRTKTQQEKTFMIAPSLALEELKPDVYNATATYKFEIKR